VTIEFVYFEDENPTRRFEMARLAYIRSVTRRREYREAVKGKLIKELPANG
jgi:hypothetical protein